MKIGIDCRILGDHKSGKTSGIGEYVFFLVQSLLERDQKNEYVLFFSRHQIIPFRGDFTRAIFDAPKIPVVNSHI
ncbi:MAG: hypothetical protein HY453_02355, partial [Parcubacteria group bacterium]|nr:hypothetical protein [Parcubacteria group bacterium]